LRVVTILGARPQFIKAALLSQLIRNDHQEFLIHTGQHFDAQMSDVFFRELGLPAPDVNLGIGGGPNYEQVSRMVQGLSQLLAEQRPDWVLVYGDTNSTLAGALSARFLDVPLAHVEAGLRSYNREMPEETNRVLADHLSDALFCPSQTAVANLEREVIAEKTFMVVDVMIDVLLHFRPHVDESLLDRLGVEKKRYRLATIHRAGNTDDPCILTQIINSFNQLDDQPLILPVHPRLRNAIREVTAQLAGHVKRIEPVGYLDMICLTSNASLVLTDSGGLQKEAYALEVPCVTIRDETEWIETIETGWNRLGGTQTRTIMAAVEVAGASKPPTHPDLYGDGTASQRIVSELGWLTAER
jgi:UDP-GlcNAc3NAcA epimerase